MITTCNDDELTVTLTRLERSGETVLQVFRTGSGFEIVTVTAPVVVR